MKKLVYAMLVVMVMGLIACGDATEQNEQSVTGMITNVTENTLMLQSDSGQVYSFSTMDVVMEDINGLLLSDKVQIFYKGELAENAEPQQVTVTKIVEIAQDPILGCWTQPIPESEGIQGIKFMDGGIAESINMTSVMYKTWTRDSLLLILTGQNVVAEQMVDFSDTLTIQTLDDQNLVLLKGDVQNTYTKNREMMIQ